MVVTSFHLRWLVLFFILIQSVSLYKILASDNLHPDSSFHEDSQNNMVYENDDEDDADIADQWRFRSKRSSAGTRTQSFPHRRNNRPHWNPLVAAYKRCGEFSTRDERETCFKDAVQMLFVYKL